LYSLRESRLSPNPPLTPQYVTGVIR